MEAYFSQSFKAVESYFVCKIKKTVNCYIKIFEINCLVMRRKNINILQISYVAGQKHKVISILMKILCNSFYLILFYFTVEIVTIFGRDNKCLPFPNTNE